MKAKLWELRVEIFDAYARHGQRQEEVWVVAHHVCRQAAAYPAASPPSC